MENRDKPILYKALGLDPELFFVCPGEFPGQTKIASSTLSNGVVCVFRFAEPVPKNRYDLYVGEK